MQQPRLQAQHTLGQHTFTGLRKEGFRGDTALAIAFTIAYFPEAAFEERR